MAEKAVLGSRLGVLEPLPVLQSCWLASMHEPFHLGLTLNFIVHDPWELRNHDTLLDLGREVHHVWGVLHSDSWPLLHELLQLLVVLEAM